MIVELLGCGGWLWWYSGGGGVITCGGSGVITRGDDDRVTNRGDIGLYQLWWLLVAVVVEL